MSEPLFLGIDAGGSKTVCLAGDRHQTLGRGESGPANPNVGGIAGFKTAISEACAGALSQAGAGDGPVVAWIGVAGGDTEVARHALRAAALDVLGARHVAVSHDARLLLAAAGLDSGIAVVAGTGSAVYGRSRGGHEAKVGGWGHLLGDEGSGYDIVRQAFRAVTQAADRRGPATQLSAALPSALGVASIEALRERLYPAPPVPEIARLAQVVLAAASDDAVAAAILDTAARELAGAVRACRRRLDGLATHEAGRGDRAALSVVAAGGLLRPGSPLLERLERELRRDGQTLLPLAVEPAAGALALARDGPRDSPTSQVEEEQMGRAGQDNEQLPKESLR